MMRSFDIVTVGAGHAGAQAGIALRHADFSGSIAIIGKEPDYPYERPPLSKEYFSGKKSFERLLIRPISFWEERDITMLLGQEVLSVDAQAHTITTGEGGTIGYGRLIWAAGGNPRQLPVDGSDLPGVFYIRTRADADALKFASKEAERVVIVGGGYIGLEAAAVLSDAGKQVVLLEALDRVLARVAGETVSRFFEAKHQAHGVEIRLVAGVEAIEGLSRVAGVLLTSGEILAADLVIVGIGLNPVVEPLLEAGAAGGNGVRVNEYCRTSLADVYAIGDCALHENGFADGAVLRLESVQNANDQATAAVRAILGNPQPYIAVPWFWSNQYDVRLQTVGISAGYDATVTRGNPEAGSFSVAYLKQGRVIALDCVNAVRDYVQGKALVENRLQISPVSLSDVSIPLKELISHVL